MCSIDKTIIDNINLIITFVGDILFSYGTF